MNAWSRGSSASIRDRNISVRATGLIARRRICAARLPMVSNASVSAMSVRSFPVSRVWAARDRASPVELYTVGRFGAHADAGLGDASSDRVSRHWVTGSAGSRAPVVLAGPSRRGARGPPPSALERQRIRDAHPAPALDDGEERRARALVLVRAEAHLGPVEDVLVAL